MFYIGSNSLSYTVRHYKNFQYLLHLSTDIVRVTYISPLHVRGHILPDEIKMIQYISFEKRVLFEVKFSAIQLRATVWLKAERAERTTMDRKIWLSMNTRNFGCEKSSVRPLYVRLSARLPIHVSGCELFYLLTWKSKKYARLCWTWYRTSMLWSIGSWQNRVSADQCHMTVSKSHNRTLMALTVSQVQVYNSLRVF